MKKLYVFVACATPLLGLSATALAQSSLDASVSRVYLPQYAGPGAILLEGDLSNVGTEAILSYNINYRVNNGPITSEAVPGTVPAGGVGAFALSQSWTPPGPGTYRFKFWPSNVRSANAGQMDGNRANDTLRLTLQVAARVVPRQVVAEVFTSSTCPPCNPGNAQFEAVRSTRRNKMVVVKYQQNYPRNTAFPAGDPYYTTETGARHNFYGIQGIPETHLNGNGWVGNPQVMNGGTVDALAQEISVADVDVVYTLNVATRTVTASARIKPYVDVAANDLVAHMLITERHTRQNVATNGETSFVDVVKKMMPDQNGSAVPALATNQSWNLNQTFAFPASTPGNAISRVENFDSLRVVVFLQRRSNNEILQGGYARLNGVLGTQKAQSGLPFDVAPNPTTGRTTLFVSLARAETVQVEVLDALGRRVLAHTSPMLGSGAQQLPLNLTGQAPGLYTVRLTTTNGVRTQQLLVE
ncbi:T9SS type A sorting domain-containing protein [Microvirga sp. STR05]|uniref:T9SS type A sorting domain-containing protein n=1 Tax=Hymenobacter duratus TaxID=2771356 RepID=A0ABR8JJP3_9BACT|nr:T9SS type A sorting domain-containing protein [Hymenobacter duratus]MBD2717068.1 T9SS type A sorting domain-containing protein [Hymenobacter duratus]MBR7951984.1 T9SS type A sorting domain-containing protein [Microvirga sp. STR05]